MAYGKAVLWCIGLISLVIGLSPNLSGQYRFLHLDNEVIPDVTKPYWSTQASDGSYFLTGKEGLQLLRGNQAERLLLKDPDGKILQDQHQQCAVVEDNQGFIWGTTVSRLYRFDPRTGKFQLHQFEWNGEIITAGYRIFHQTDNGETLWISTGDFLWSFSTRTGSYKLLKGGTNSMFYAASPQHQFIGGVSYINGNIEVFRQTPNGKISGPLKTVLPFSAYSLCFGKVDSVFYAATKGGLFEISVGQTNLSFRQLTQSPPVSAIVYDAISDLVWQTVRRVGIVAYDTATGQQKKAYGLKQGLRDDYSRYLSVDQTGKIWASQYGQGYDVLTPTSEAFPTYGPSMMGDASDWAFREDGSLLILDREGRLYEKAGKTWIIDSSLYTGNNRRLINPRFYRQGQTLGVSSSFSFAQAEKAGKAWSFFGKPSHNVIGVFAPPRQLPITLHQEGIQSFRLAADTVLFAPVPGFANLPTEECVGVVPLSDSTFLLSYRDQEIWHCQISDGTYQVNHRIQLAGNLNGAVSFPDGRLYVAGSSGLYELIGEQARPLLQSLPGRQILSVETMTKDAKGRLWLGTTTGLVQYTPGDGSIVYFGLADGLPSERFLRLKPLHTPEGEVLMFSAAGIILFNPMNLAPTPVNIVPYVNGIWVNSLPYEDSIRAPYMDRLKRPYQQNTLNFIFSTSNLEQSPGNTIEYQLLDYDLHPLRTSAGHDILYRKLPPGDYTLQLTAINRNGLPSGKKSLSVTIDPPFTQTLLFYVLCTCVLALFAIGLYILGLRRERLKQHRLQEQQARLAAERDRIAGEVHDDLGGQISSILYLSEEMLLTGDTPEYEYELSRINELSRNSLQNVRDIIFALDNRRASLSALGEQLSAAGEAFFGDRKIGFQSSEEYDQPDFVLTSRQKRNLTLIVKEAWHNIAKHAKATVVTLDIQDVNQLLVITIADNGIGFISTTSKSSMGGYGLDNMQEKAAAIGGELMIDSPPEKGTTLRLTWPLPVNNI
jgi:signal transduction histidine kinase